jgi:hypothetical protein
LYRILKLGLLDVWDHANYLYLVDEELAVPTRRKPPGARITCGQRDAAADGVLPVEIRARVRLIDDGHARRVAPIGPFEQPAGERPNPQRREKLGGNLVHVRQLVVGG